MHEPELLILDEPIAGLDPLVQQSFHALLAEVAAQGRTVFLSSHTLLGGRARRRPRRDPAPRAARGRRLAREPAGDRGAAARDRVRRRGPGARDAARAARRPRGDARAARTSMVAFEGSADPLIKALAAYEVRSIRSRDDDLEEIFLRYYREDDGVS